jgi:hypothetical protein
MQFIIKYFRLSVLTVASLFLFTSSNLAQAADEAGQYLIMGLGNASCESFTAEDELGQAYYLSWLAGYMTAYNYIQKETYSIMGETKTVNQIQSWLKDYCTINPDVKFEGAVRKMIINLRLFRSKTRP